MTAPDGRSDRPTARVLLIGGTSHAGKSTLAARLAQRLGWVAASTDSLARHPGRPWPAGGRPVPDHVRAHYAELGDEELLASVLAHYERLAPRILEHVDHHLATQETGLVLEGSALLPATMARLREGRAVRAVVLRLDEDALWRRVAAQSGWHAAGPQDRLLVDRFAERARRFDRLVGRQAAELGIATVASPQDGSAAELEQAVLDATADTGEAGPRAPLP